PPKYNSIRIFNIPKYKNIFLEKYNEKEFIEMKAKGNLHYTGPKPWRSYSVNFQFWWAYYDRQPVLFKTSLIVNNNIYWLYKFHNTFFGEKILRVLIYIKRLFN